MELRTKEQKESLDFDTIITGIAPEDCSDPELLDLERELERIRRMGKIDVMYTGVDEGDGPLFKRKVRFVLITKVYDLLTGTFENVLGRFRYVFSVQYHMLRYLDRKNKEVKDLEQRVERLEAALKKSAKEEA
ncbi:MAG: hypothetical protein K5891_09430 [Lachnospiraceae bacterium]|nr:hypothetical protein [Lachnospiraceae bacterium]